VIYGPPEIGKSALAVTIAGGFLKQGAPGLYIENEEPARDTVLRFASHLSDMDVQSVLARPDEAREIAQAVVQGLMQGYLDQSLQWQKLSASNASEFIAEQLDLAIDRLQNEENALRDFAESERAVQLDTQAEMTIENAAALEARTGRRAW